MAPTPAPASAPTSAQTADQIARDCQEAALHYPLADTLPAPGRTLELADGVRWLRMGHGLYSPASIYVDVNVTPV